MNKPVKTVVIKLGTSTLTAGTKHLNRAHMLEIVRVTAKLIAKGYAVALVSSGAMAAGRELLKDPQLPPLMSSKQLLAAVGQGKLIEIWESLFSIYDLKIGQILLTRADLTDRERYLNARDALQAVLSHGIIPIINENDAVSTQEIKVGDNDNLAVLSALLCDADQVILLTDQKGLYTSDPRHDPKAKLIAKLDEINDDILKLAGGSGTQLGTGGMQTKLQAAKIAMHAGIELVIASGQDPQLLLSLVQGQGEATFCTPDRNVRQARKAWIGAALKASGSVIVDDGAARALLRQGSSLLPSGLLQVEGNFARGSVVAVKNLRGQRLGQGLVRYSSSELNAIKGLHSDEIAAKLGFSHGDVIMHRDDLTLD